MTDQDWTPRDYRLVAWMLRELRSAADGGYVDLFARAAELDKEADSMDLAEASPREKPGAADDRMISLANTLYQFKRTAGDDTRVFQPIGFTLAHVQQALRECGHCLSVETRKPFLHLLDGEKK